MYFVVEEEELSKEVKMLGFPIVHKHKLCCLRQELIDSFVDSRYMMFIKYAAYHLQQLNLRKNEEKLSNNKAIADKPEVNGEETKPNAEENSKDETTEKDDKEEKKSQMEDAEAKKIVESITDGSKLERKLFNVTVCIYCSLLFLQ